VLFNFVCIRSLMWFVDVQQVFKKVNVDTYIHLYLTKQIN
jgi:hypothetical protein